MKRKAIFLDKDGTLIPDIPYNVDPSLITLAEGVPEGLQLLQKAGYIFIVISNQAGVARGHFQFKQLEKVSTKITELLKASNIKIEAFYYCPHLQSGSVEEYSIDCDCRKPKPGMLLTAANDLEIDLTTSWMIGDILNDCEAGKRAGCQTILINNSNETEWLKGPFREPDFISENFLEAANFILSNTSHTIAEDERKMAAM
jgi:D,D-heptose 1,7-bisphosphate phosphatase